MTTNKVKDAIKEHFKEYLEELNIPTRKSITCLNPMHDDKDPSMRYYEEGNCLKCFGCNTTYDIFSLYALNNNLDNTKDFKKIVEDLKEKYHITSEEVSVKPIKQTTKKYEQKKEDYSKKYDKWHKDINLTNYLQEKRGISERLIDKYNIGYDKEKDLIILPCSKNYYEARTTKETKFYSKLPNTQVELFNSDNIRNSKYKDIVFITESIIDALSLEEVIEDIKTLALNGVNNYNLLIDLLKENEFKGAIILALDNDHNSNYNTGRKTSEEIEKILKEMNITCYALNNNDEAYKGNKDINEYLLSDKDKLKNDISYIKSVFENLQEQKARKLLEGDNALSYLDKFIELTKNQEDNKPISTGISKLDNALNGGLYKQNLIILGGLSSLGKTTLALQIADNIARSKVDMLIFSLEMSKKELIAKSISRIMYNNLYEKSRTGLSLTTSDILKGVMYDTKNNARDLVDRLNYYEEALKEYKEKIAPYIFISECEETLNIDIKAIEERIKRQIEITGNRPIVVIDYLQIIQNEGNRNLTDKQAIDRNLTNLKRIARNYNITIIVISSLNRSAYTGTINLDSFKESGNIEYTADILLGLQLEAVEDIKDTNTTEAKKVVNKEQQQEIRKLTLRVLKNRNGKIGDIKKLSFYAKNNYMKFNDFDENYNPYESDF